MQLKNQLYSIESREGNSFRFRLNPECFIYKAHFPGNPITPGVCIVQIVSEFLEEITGRQLCITELKNVKFLSILSPIDNPVAEVVFSTIDDDGDTIRAQAIVKAGDTEFTSVSLVASNVLA